MLIVDQKGKLVNTSGRKDIGVRVESLQERIIQTQPFVGGIVGLGEFGNLYALTPNIGWVQVAFPPTLLRLIDDNDTV